MLSLYKLEIFAMVVRMGSFSAAAERLLMTQSAVSQHILDLEQTLGTQLFRRGRRGVTLTPAGETLYGYTQDILRLVAEAETAVTTPENLTDGSITIGATPGVGVYILPNWLQSFRQEYPQFTTHLKTDITPHILEQVRDHRLALGFVEGELDDKLPETLGVLTLQALSMHVIVGRDHPWWGKEAVSADALNDQAFISRQPNSQTRAWLGKLAAQHRLNLRIVAEFDNLESIKRAVCTGMGIAILPDYVVEMEVQQGRLATLGVSDLLLERTLKMLWDRETPFSPITRTFLQHLAERFPALDDLTLA
ncbi:MAG: LysR family transcriptional regulator [Anaerolineales bacterium]